jgi:DNA (cytosine-5)-methyltransferase 1
MNHGSLFSGIGGFDLAAEWMGWENVFHCEWMPFPRKILHHYWPNSISYEDVTKTDFTIHRGGIDILTGGFPCQPYSSAGKRLGKEDERHLWPHMLRAISEIKPTYVVGENVRGLTNWNGGMVFEEVCTDLEAQGYEVQPILLPAAAVGAPHRRDRIWFVACSNGSMFRTEKYGSIRCENGENETERTQGIYDAVRSNGNSGTATNTNSIRQHKRECDNEEFASERGINALNDINENDGQGNVTDTNSFRLQGSISSREHDVFQRNRQDKKNVQHLHSFKSRLRFENFPTEPPICGGDDGLPTELDGITFPKWRQESIKGYGNAIVPQVAYQIFKVIAEMDAREKVQLKLF